MHDAHWPLKWESNPSCASDSYPRRASLFMARPVGAWEGGTRRQGIIETSYAQRHYGDPARQHQTKCCVCIKGLKAACIQNSAAVRRNEGASNVKNTSSNKSKISHEGASAQNAPSPQGQELMMSFAARCCCYAATWLLLLTGSQLAVPWRRCASCARLKAASRRTASPPSSCQRVTTGLGEEPGPEASAASGKRAAAQHLFARGGRVGENKCP